MKTALHHTKASNSRKGFYAPGTLYPHFTGGMEIFNYYFIRKRLADDPEAVYFFSDHPAPGAGGTYLPYKPIKPVRLFYPLLFLKALWKVRRQVDFGMVCFAEQSWIISFAQALAFRICGVPYFVVIHWGKLPEWKWKWTYRYYFNNAAAVVGVSDYICTAYRKEFPEARLRFIPPLIPFEKAPGTKEALRTAAGLQAGQFPFLFVGTLKDMKNPDLLVRAASCIGASELKKHNVVFVLAGQGPLMDDLKAQVAAAGLGEFFHFAGLVSREQIPVYYGMAGAYIIPSDYEGTPLSMLEAMFNGLPILGSDASGINTVLEDGRNGLLFPVKDEKVLASQVLRLLEDPALAARMGAQALADYENRYSFEKMIQTYDELIAESLQPENSNKGRDLPVLNS